MTGEKKKMKSRFGVIDVNKKHPITQSEHGFAVTPYMQERMLFAGQQETFDEGADLIQRFLCVQANPSQVQRLCRYYGNEPSVEQVLTVPAPVSVGAAQPGGSVLYAGVDGSMLHTDDGYLEVKLGRVFDAKSIEDGGQSSPRTTIAHSEYVAHLGSHKEFIGKFSQLLQAHASKASQLVLLSDGAPWIRKWASKAFPAAILILDFFHVMEYLFAFANLALKDESRRKQWCEEQRLLLLQSQSGQVITNILELPCKTRAAKGAQKRAANYYRKNKERMDYAHYKKQGWYIGSGMIESAHRTVIQKRLRLSGQRWNTGAQPILNLRACFMSKKWDNVIDVICKKSCKMAA
jgi:hypothetical protein